MDFREKILREGTLKHRQTGALARWKNRHVVFKVSGGGRLQFIIHKDFPPSPANEVKEIPIEEFGGLESTAKVDSEKHVFSIITTSVTDSFSTEGVEDLAEWTSLLQEYLGKVKENIRALAYYSGMPLTVNILISQIIRGAFKKSLTYWHDAIYNELTFGIVIPQRQGQLKSGRGVLRIRNTGFTITTSDSPPRCMGTWQITHIRKFGGSSTFKFQTGSKCTTGEMLYTIKTDDNDRVKSLFNDLSQHKPIFSDDRVGRRMTLERNHTHHSPYRQSPSRLSLQSTTGGAGRDREGSDSTLQSSTLSPTYENKEAICEAAMKLGKPLPLPPNRRNSANDNCTPSLAGHAQRQGSGNNNPAPLSPALAKVDEQRLYQNIPGRSGSAPHSPTKLHRSGPGGTRYPIPPSEPVPDGYYNVSPPLALKKYPSTHSSSSPPRLSPEDDTFVSEFAPVPPPPIKTVSSTTSDSYSDAYFRLPLQQRPMMKIEGENLVVHRTPNGGYVGGEGEGGKGGGKEEASLYQNLDFMSKRGSDGITTANVYMEDTDSGPVHSQVHSGTGGHPLPIIPALDSPSDMVHNYTNVEFAFEAAQGRGGRIGGTSKPLARAGDVRRKVSAPPLSRDRSGAMSYKDSSPSCDATATPVTMATTTTTNAVTSNLALSLHPKLKPSLSSYDLKEVDGKQEANRSDLLPEYYNLFVPRLPANQGRGEGEGGHEGRSRRIHATLSSFQSPSFATAAGSKSIGRSGRGGVANGQVTCTQSTDVADSTQKKPSPPEKSSDKEEGDDDDDKVLVNPNAVGYATVDSHIHGRTVPVSSAASLAPRYDHLELVRTSSGSQSTRFSPTASPSPENLSRSNTPRPQPLYDQLSTKEMTPPTGEKREESVGGENITNGGGKVSIPYEKKIGVLGHAHTYEYIEVMLQGGGRNGGNGGSRVPGPDTTSSPRHNSDPGRCESGTGTPVLDTPINEHPSQWTNSPPQVQDTTSSLPRSPATQSRRKPLPLQSVPLDESFSVAPPSRPTATDNRPLPKTRKFTNSEAVEQEVGVAPGGSRERSRSPTVPRPPVKHVHQRSSGGGEEGERVAAEKPPPRVPTRAISVTHPSQQFEDSPAVPPRRDQSSFTVSLPATEFQFDKPLVPPKPRVLEHKPNHSGGAVGGIQYATMRFSHAEDDSNYTQVCPNQRTASVASTAGGSGGGGGKGEVVTDATKVVYQSIDFDVTEGLRKTKEDRDIQRNREIEWLQREQNLLKTTLTCTAK